MQLRFSILARDRTFSKAMRRVRVRFKPLLEAFEATELHHPIHEAILVGITDAKGPEFFEQVVNNEGFFQVLAGCSLRETDNNLAEDVYNTLERAVRACPFATPDQTAFEALFGRFRPALLGD